MTCGPTRLSGDERRYQKLLARIRASVPIEHVTVKIAGIDYPWIRVLDPDALLVQALVNGEHFASVDQLLSHCGLLSRRSIHRILGISLTTRAAMLWTGVKMHMNVRGRDGVLGLGKPGRGQIPVHKWRVTPRSRSESGVRQLSTFWLPGAVTLRAWPCIRTTSTS